MSSRVEPETHLLACVLTGNASILMDNHVAAAKKAGHVVINVRLNSGSEAQVQSLTCDPKALDLAIDRVITAFEQLGKRSFYTGIIPGDLSKSKHYNAMFESYSEKITKKERELKDQEEKARLVELDQQIEQKKIEQALMVNATEFDKQAFQEFLRRLRETNKATVQEAAKMIYAQDQKSYEEAMRMMTDVTDKA